MRAAPAFQLSLTRFGVWRSGVITVAVLGALTLAAWAIGRERSAWADAAVLLAFGPLVWIAWSLVQVAPVDLRWDGQVWSVAPLGHGSDSAPSGALRVVIDLGPWMLLRFEPAAGGRPNWLPAQRAGIAPHWHALRCAVHASPASAGPPVGAE